GDPHLLDAPMAATNENTSCRQPRRREVSIRSLKLMNSGVKPVTVSIVEDDSGTREQLISLLNESPPIRCLAAYGTAEEALKLIVSDPPDVALVDINLP